MKNYVFKIQNVKIIKLSSLVITAEHAKIGALSTMLRVTQLLGSTVRRSATPRPLANPTLTAALAMTYVSLKVNMKMSLFISNVHLARHNK